MISPRRGGIPGGAGDLPPFAPLFTNLLYLLTGLLITIFQGECLTNTSPTAGLSVTSTDLMVIPDVLPSTVGIGVFTKIVGSMIYLTPHVLGGVVGLLLPSGPAKRSDAWLTFANPRSTPEEWDSNRARGSSYCRKFARFKCFINQEGFEVWKELR